MGLSDFHRNELLRILQHKLLTPLFQPLVTLTNGQIWGYEALIRGPSDSALHSPILLFKTALAFDLLEPLEMLCRELSINAFAEAAVEGFLFLNVNPKLLLTSDHPSGLTKRFIQQAGLQPDRIVIELSEQFQVEDTELFISAVKHYREFGFKVAIDDLGSGFSGLKLWSELQPDIVKIDRYFIDQLHRDPIKKAFVKNIIEIAKNTGSSIVAEGIETSEELITCKELGAELGQGYLLGRPEAECRDVSAKAAQLLRIEKSLPFNESLEPVISKVAAVNEQTPAKQVALMFANDKNLPCVAVVDAWQQPVGIVSKSMINERFSHQFGRALYEKKAIKHCMEQAPVVVERKLSMDNVSAILSAEANEDASLYFIVTDNAKYYGLGSVRKVLRQISEHKIQLARYANPLTLLPGNVPINTQIDKLLQQEQSFTIAYIDIDNFKPYNDQYGYSKGDLVIELLAQIIQSESDTVADFIGHIGGDDFIVLFGSDHAEATSARILKRFEQRVKHYYLPEHVQQGGFSAMDRLGVASFYPLITLSIGLATPDPLLCRSHHDVAALASAAKQQAKKQTGSSIFVNKRRAPDNCQNGLNTVLPETDFA
ncbi:bifunctional diguanylate cyclase/phosphodiesterase [Rheinheimera aquimaris]|uniref:Bifunctional diguanylate cyclase/phosphodiesterase n=1 Tax=Rheinheimera aquimaris TaxID=412437 RepID=A0ABP3NTS9_9GAMM|nr:bifunctional diguanylate cyclase/phosphodiesterase [Rheinheimera aquimaris]MCB5214042.1 EAL and GGDEF domain-containing protein [Rheinheimera aquimaris]